MTMVTCHANYFMPGILFSESRSTRLDAEGTDVSKWMREAVDKAPSNAFCFQLYTLTTDENLKAQAEALGQELRPKRTDVTGRIYIDAEIYNLSQVESMEGKEILASNMRNNGWNQVVRCKTGNFQPLQPEDKVVFSNEPR